MPSQIESKAQEIAVVILGVVSVVLFLAAPAILVVVLHGLYRLTYSYPC